MSFARSRRDTSFDGSFGRSASTPPAMPKFAYGSSLAAVAATPPPSPSRPLRLPSNIAAAARVREAERSQKDTGSFSYRNPYFKFVGETKNGAPHGYGVMYFADGGMTEGLFNEQGELTCDEGCRRWPDGSTYEGPLYKGEAHGNGRYYGANGEEYHGEFAAGFRDGKGHVTNRAQGTEYRGSFRKGLFDGEGVLSTPDVHIAGSFRKGRAHGPVTIDYSNGDQYVGPAADGRPCCAPGEGRFTSKATGVKYCGALVNGRRCVLPNAAMATDVMVGGTPHPPQQLTKKRSTVMSVASAAAQASGLKVAKRLPARKTTIDEEPQPRYIDQLRTSLDRFITVPFHQPLSITVALARREEARKPSLPAAVRKVTGKVDKNAKEYIDIADRWETGRTVRVQVFQFPDGVSAYALEEYHAKSSPSPVLIHSTEVADAFAVSYAKRGEPTSPVASLKKTGSMSTTRSLPPLRSQSMSVRSKAGMSTASRSTMLDLPKPTETELRGITVDGVATFQLRLSDPGNFYVRIDVPSGCQAVQREPGVNPKDSDMTALAPCAGYVPLRVMRQC